MEKDSTSFWADIKRYEDTLSRDPRSYCFAPLSEVYRKLGLLDDAIGTAKRGVEIHPEYIGGYMALGRAYYEKGMRPEARESLEKVVRATPENLLAQKLLSHIFLEEGNIQEAEQALRILISFNPEDAESRLALEALQRGGTAPDVAEPAEGYGEDVDEEATVPVTTEVGIESGAVISEDISTPAPMQHTHDDGTSWEVFAFDEPCDVTGSESGEDETGTAPLPTITLAELYEAQGYNEQALAVYRELLLIDPENHVIKQRVEALQGHVGAEETALSTLSVHDEEHALQQLNTPETMFSSEANFAENGEDTFRSIGREEKIVETLEKWLDSLRREKACRSREL